MTKFSDSQIHHTFRIENQEWMQYDLKVHNFRNGDKIYQATNLLEWLVVCGSHAPAVYVIDGNFIYNFYAINDPRGLVPEGWRIPNEEDWRYALRHTRRDFIEKFIGNLDRDYNMFISQSNGLMDDEELLLDIMPFLKGIRVDLYPQGNDLNEIIQKKLALFNWWNQGCGYFTVNDNTFRLTLGSSTFNGNCVRCVKGEWEKDLNIDLDTDLITDSDIYSEPYEDNSLDNDLETNSDKHLNKGTENKLKQNRQPTIIQEPNAKPVLKEVSNLDKSEPLLKPTLAYFISSALLAVFALIKFPTTDYFTLRLLITGLSIYCIIELKNKKGVFGYFLIAAAILFNPIIPFYFQKEIWIIIDVIGSITFALIGIWLSINIKSIK